MKRIASLFCTVLILLSICTIPASAHEECSFSKNHVPYKVTFSNSIDDPGDLRFGDVKLLRDFCLAHIFFIA